MPSAADELPMDEMVIDELDELDDIDLAEDDSVEQAVSASDALADLAPESLDDGFADENEMDEGLFDDLEKELDDLDLDSAVEDTPKEKLEESAEDSTEEKVSDDFETELIDEEPEFSLDDFAPDPLDQDDIEKK